MNESEIIININIQIEGCILFFFLTKENIYKLSHTLTKRVRE